MEQLREIRIDIKNKIACLSNPNEEPLVCDNNDYEIVFSFDSDWDDCNVKTAVFVFGKEPVYEVFEGNICKGVAVTDATLCAIGVFSGNIKTTTGATIKCLPSITTNNGKPKPPKSEVYDEIMALLDKAIQAHTELPVGGKKGQVLKKVSDKDYDTEWADDEQRNLDDYQTKSDSGLDTDNKTIVGAINELNVKVTEINAMVAEATDILSEVVDGGAF